MTQYDNTVLQQFADKFTKEVLEPFYGPNPPITILMACPIDVVKLNYAQMVTIGVFIAKNLCKAMGITYSRYLESQHMSDWMREVFLMYRYPPGNDSSRKQDLLGVDRVSLIERVGRLLMSGAIETALVKYHQQSTDIAETISITTVGTLMDVDTQVSSLAMTISSILDDIIAFHEDISRGNFNVRYDSVKVFEDRFEFTAIKVYKVTNYSTISNK